jgi:hypothetical protein
MLFESCFLGLRSQHFGQSKICRMNLKLRSAFCVLFYEELVDVRILMARSPTQINHTKYLMDKMPENPLHCQPVV